MPVGFARVWAGLRTLCLTISALICLTLPTSAVHADAAAPALFFDSYGRPIELIGSQFRMMSPHGIQRDFKTIRIRPRIEVTQTIQKVDSATITRTRNTTESYGGPLSDGLKLFASFSLAMGDCTGQVRADRKRTTIAWTCPDTKERTAHALWVTATAEEIAARKQDQKVEDVRITNHLDHPVFIYRTKPEAMIRAEKLANAKREYTDSE